MVYCILKTNILEHIVNFKILDFGPYFMTSNVHYIFWHI